MMPRLLHWLPKPKSLQRQFALALSVPALLIVAGGLVAFYDSRITTFETRQLADVRMARLQQAQELDQCALLIHSEAGRMLAADTIESMQAGYIEIQKRLDLLDSLVLRLGQASNDLSILSMTQAGQLFRNTVHIVAQLRKNLLTGRLDPPESTRQQADLIYFKDELHHQAVSLVNTTGSLSDRFTLDYVAAMRQVAAASEQQTRRALALLAGSLLLAGLISRYFLGLVIKRLQRVSNTLRVGETSADVQGTVQGNDEIGDMARAVEQFLTDRRLLVQTQHDLRQHVDKLQKAFDEIKTLRGIIPICSSCKKIRDDRGYWNQIEIYISEHSEADFSHGICPECARELYSDYVHFQQIGKAVTMATNAETAPPIVKGIENRPEKIISMKGNRGTEF